MDEELRPGFASEEPEDAEPEPVPKDLQVAHYGGFSDTEAADVWRRETLCMTCLSVGVCRIAAGVQEPMVVVSRCLAYLPATG